MAQIHFIRLDGVTPIYDVVRGDEVIGMVWQVADTWYADRCSMSNPSISGSGREEVAAQL